MTKIEHQLAAQQVVIGILLRSLIASGQFEEKKILATIEAAADLVSQSDEGESPETISARAAIASEVIGFKEFVAKSRTLPTLSVIDGGKTE